MYHFAHACATGIITSLLPLLVRRRALYVKESVEQLDHCCALGNPLTSRSLSCIHALVVLGPLSFDVLTSTSSDTSVSPCRLNQCEMSSAIAVECRCGSSVGDLKGSKSMIMRLAGSRERLNSASFQGSYLHHVCVTHGGLFENGASAAFDRDPKCLAGTVLSMHEHACVSSFQRRTLWLYSCPFVAVLTGVAVALVAVSMSTAQGVRRRIVTRRCA